MFKYIRNLVAPLRNPFKTCQEKLEIVEEWRQFKMTVRPHSWKLVFLSGVLAYPYLREKGQILKQKSIDSIANSLKDGQPIEQVLNNFVKSEVNSILRDQNVQQESIDFVQRLGKQAQLQESIVNLLKDSIQNPIFINESKVYGKRLVLDLLDDEQIRKASQEMIISVLNDSLTKFEVKEFCKNLSQEEEIKDAVVDILKKTGEDPLFRSSLANAFQFALNDMMLRKETTIKLRMFLFYLLEQETNQDQSIKSVVDLIISKVINTKTQKSKSRDFDMYMQKLLGQDVVDDLESNRKSHSETFGGVF